MNAILLTPEQLAELIVSTGGARQPKHTAEPPHRGKEDKKAKAKRKAEKASRRKNRRR